MTTRRTGKIWLGIGAATMIGTGGGAAWPQATGNHSSGHVNQAKPEAQRLEAQGKVAPDAASADTAAPQGGEGGEGGEGAAANLDSRVRFFRDMGLIRGHLLVGDELRDVFIERQSGDRVIAILAARGRRELDSATGELAFVLYDGRRYEGVPGQGKFLVVDFGEQRIPVRPKQEREFKEAAAATLENVNADEKAGRRRKNRH